MSRSAFAPIQALARRRRHARNSSIDALPVRLGATDATQTRALPMRVVGFDEMLLCIVVAFLVWGLVMVYSASIAISDKPGFAQVSGYTQSYFLTHHAASLGVACIAAVIVFQVPMRLWERAAPWIFVSALLLLVVVLVPHIGRSVNGSHRWIPLFVTNFQPSELAKLAMVLYAADYMVRKLDIKERFFRAVWPMALAVLIVGLLLLAEPDMGAFMVIAVIAMGILFLGGVNVRMFSLIALLVVIAFSLIVAASPWRRERIFASLDPWSATNALGKGYQLSHALIAVGRGRIWGVGLGGSVEKLNWLPEAHTDFLLAVIGEEFGLVGVLVVIVMFTWMTRRIMHIGRQAIVLDRVFSGLVAQGIGVWIGFQAFINVGVNLGALPTKGLTLPLMSYGGSAIVMMMIGLAIVLRVDRENRTLMRGGRV
ncbi:MAG: putative lipid II flippase FtsW [Burkholderiaceae bacterium]|jgi:cell division protein FtsW|nr:putative lipid II flippase FtsW [Burkholderiaceae bacterium]